MGDIFLKLLNMSIMAGWLILAVICFRLLFRKVPKWIHCLLWGVVAIRLLCPFSLESAFGLLNHTELIKTSTAADGEVQAYIPQINSEWSVVENTVNPMLAESFAYEESESVAPLQVATYIAGMVWIFGMALLLVGAVISLVRLRILVRAAVTYRDNIMICDAVKSPFILGLFKPQIFLSSGLSNHEIDYIVAHEQAHLKRKDHWWKPLGYLLLCVYWFNPLCWAAYILLCKDIELACDERVIRDMDMQDRKAYSRTLLSCADQRRLVMACPLAFGEVGVKERVKTVLNYKKPKFWMVVIALLLCLIVAVCFLTTSQTESDNMGDEIVENTILEENSVYSKIIAALDDEVAYAFLVMDYPSQVLLTSQLIYDEGSEPQAAISCDVYYPVEGKVRKVGTIASDGTARPIRFSKDGIYTASLHSVQKYAFGEDGSFLLEWTVEENFDTNGNATYTSIRNGKENITDVSELRKIQAEYEKSQIVHLSYGANGSVNELLSEDAAEMQDYQDIPSEVYRELLEELVETKCFPATNGIQCAGEVYDNSYGVMDVDNDGKEELLINFSNTDSMAGMTLYIYDYDPNTNEVYIEYSGWPNMTIYDTGYIKEEASHNHGRSNLEEFWPYTLLKYNPQTDKYESVAHIDAWQDTYEDFPKEADADGDGIVYYDWSDYDAPTMIMDQADYDAWCRTYYTGSICQILWHPIISEEKYIEMFVGQPVG